MNKAIHASLCIGLATALLAAAPPRAQADDGPGLVETVFGTPGFNFGYGGFIRNEFAVSLEGDTNPWNQTGNIFNGKRVKRMSAVATDTVVRNADTKDDPINLEYVRGEVKFEMKFTSKLRFKGTLRAIFDPLVYEVFEPGDVPLVDPVGTLQGDPNFFEYRYDSCPALLPFEEPGGGDGTPFNNPAAEAAQRDCLQAKDGSGWLEVAGNDYMVDLARFYFDYQTGGLSLRLGVQQIAWGDMLFFRVLDVPNGLDLRRHSVLDFAPEEFSDKRIPSFGLRASYLVPWGVPLLHGWNLDSYVQRFRSTIYPNPNTPYNVIASQFTVHDQYEQYDDEYNYGLRFTGDAGPLSLTFMINRRYNHFGVFQWTDADVAQGLQPFGPTALGGIRDDQEATEALIETLFFGGSPPRDLPADPPIDFEIAATAAAFADTAFEVDPTGPVSGEEFATYGALARLDHLNGVNEAIVNFVGAPALGAVPVTTATAQERQEDLFHQLSGGLRGHITRDYFRENNYGIGIGWTMAGWNIDVEAKYTPDRHYTPLTLSPQDGEIIVEDEWEVGVVGQTFYRWSAGFPSAFLVFQYLFRDESDIFNRHLSGFGGEYDNFDDDEAQIGDGISSFNALVFAFQQPFPNRIWRIDFSSLLDVQGGLLTQLGLRYKPNTEWTFQVFATVIETIYGLETENALSTVDFADEITTRISYQF